MKVKQTECLMTCSLKWDYDITSNKSVVYIPPNDPEARVKSYSFMIITSILQLISMLTGWDIALQIKLLSCIHNIKQESFLNISLTFLL